MPAADAALKAVHGVFQAGSKALDSHSPRSADAPILLFAARQRTDLVRVRNEWRDLLPAIEIVDMDADHYTIMRPPAIDAIAARIARIMTATHNRTDAVRTAARTAFGSEHATRP